MTSKNQNAGGGGARGCDLHSSWQKPASTGCDGISSRRAPSLTELEDEASEASAEVVEFARPISRSYLDACREQGVFNAKEEIIDSIAKVKAEAAALREILGHASDEDKARAAELRRRRAEGEAADAAEYRSLIEQHDCQADAARAAVTERFRAFMEAYAERGQGGPFFKALMILMFESEVPGREASKLIRGLIAAHDDDSVSPSWRLNGEGLNGPR